MKRDLTFHDYIVHDLLGERAAITSQAMFGGWALYERGVIFGIITGGELYFKVGVSNRADFEALGSHPFVYSKKGGRAVTLSYWLVPETVFEDRERLNQLVDKSVRVSSTGNKHP